MASSAFEPRLLGVQLRLQAPTVRARLLCLGSHGGLCYILGREYTTPVNGYLEFDQFGLHTTLEVKTIQALYYKAGKDRLLTIVLTRDVEGKRPDQMFYCTKLDWTAREILSAYACRWAIECTFENCKQFLGLEDPANRLPKAVVRTAPMALFIYTLVVIWFHQTGHQLLRFPFRPWYTKKEEPSFADMLTTLRRVSYQEKTPQPLPEQSGLKTWIAQVTELLSRTG